MNLQDLLSDLDEYDEGRESEMAPRYPVERVARRLASLYQNCLTCAGTGWSSEWTIRHSGLMDSALRQPCFWCGGTGAVPSVRWPDWRGNGPTIDPPTLYHFLFGDEIR